MIYKSILKMTLAKLCFGSTSKTSETHPSLSANTQQYIDHLNALGSIENKHSNRLGFMEGEGRVPNDFNTMCASKVESMFYENK